MPKACAASGLAVTAAKCPPVAAAPILSASHARPERALASVSCVVKVLEATMKSVVSGLSPSSAAARCAPSTFDTKCTRGRGRRNAVSASVTKSGPRSEPPIPMLITSVNGRPLQPARAPLAISSQNCPMRRSVRSTSSTTLCPSTTTGSRARSAVCNAARPSVVLTRAPVNSSSMDAGSSRSAASASRARRMSSSTRCLEKSNRMPAHSREYFWKRCGSPLNSSRKCIRAACGRRCCSACHAGSWRGESVMTVALRFPGAAAAVPDTAF
jgi:hypothetical protein